jgi:hypothetical protein
MTLYFEGFLPLKESEMMLRIFIYIHKLLKLCLKKKFETRFIQWYFRGGESYFVACIFIQQAYLLFINIPDKKYF